MNWLIRAIRPTRLARLTRRARITRITRLTRTIRIARPTRLARLIRITRLTRLARPTRFDPLTPRIHTIAHRGGCWKQGQSHYSVSRTATLFQAIPERPSRSM